MPRTRPRRSPWSASSSGRVSVFGAGGTRSARRGLGWPRERRRGEAGGGRGQQERSGLDSGRVSAVLRKPCGWASPAHGLALHPFLRVLYPLAPAGILVFSCGHERRGLGLQATGLNSGRAQAWHSRLGDVSKRKPPIVVYLGGPSLAYLMAKSCSILSPRKARALGLGHHLWSGPKRASPLRPFPERTLNLLY